MTATFSLQTTPCTTLKGVGPKFAERLQRLGIFTVQDLLFHLPTRYQDRTRLTPIRHINVGDHVLISGTIQSTQWQQGRRRSLVCLLQDHTSLIRLRFFHYADPIRKKLQTGERLVCFGQVRNYRGLEMVHPEFRLVDDEGILSVEERLTPIYPTTEGVQQKILRSLIAQALAILQEGASLKEWLPEALREPFQAFTLSEAIYEVHRPSPEASTALLEAGQHPAQQRLVFEELLAHRLSLRRLRQRVQAYAAPALTQTSPLIKSFLVALPFTLTEAQQRVTQEILHDLKCSSPMWRLLQGDVGSGKTVVAALAMLQAVSNGYQAALMAPTELLAEQHYRNFQAWLAPLAIPCVWLSGQSKGKARRITLNQIETGEAPIVIGTHALFQRAVQFHKLGLIIIDEQHRFGVDQRLALREKGADAQQRPHQLIMTATPIPRTLAMTAYADLDISVIDELPPGRTPVKTVAISNERREAVMERVRQACKVQRQAYWICSLIDESESLQCQAAEVTANTLQTQLADLRIGLVHGRLKAQEKDEIMTRFKQGAIDLLVATTVIEVGVDIPNASLMIIENAERFGLAQLHQLRGRVGRGAIASHCVLLYQSPLTDHAQERLHVLRDSQDGFVIAKKDLALRGPGEVLGTRQTGVMQLKIADILRDQALLPRVQQAAEQLMAKHESAVEPIIKRWLGNDEQYAVV